MAKEDFTKQINFSGRFASIDKRYANGNTPYASTDEVISILGSGILSAKYVGFTVLIKESGWTEAKEYWVQPKGTTPETYGLIEKGAGVIDYEDLENLPKINNIELKGNKATSDLGLATAAQGDKADTAIQGVSVNGTEVTPDPTTRKVALTIVNGKSAYQLYLDDYEDEHGSTDGALDEAAWLESLQGKSALQIYNETMNTSLDEAGFINVLKQNYPMEYVAYNQTAAGQSIGTAFAAIDQLDASASTAGKLYLMPNDGTTPTGTELFVTVQTDATTYMWYRLGALSVPSNVLTEDDIVDDFSGGANKVLSAEAGKNIFVDSARTSNSFNFNFNGAPATELNLRIEPTLQKIVTTPLQTRYFAIPCKGGDVIECERNDSMSTQLNFLISFIPFRITQPLVYSQESGFTGAKTLETVNYHYRYVVPNDVTYILVKVRTDSATSNNQTPKLLKLNDVDLSKTLIQRFDEKVQYGTDLSSLVTSVGVYTNGGTVVNNNEWKRYLLEIKPGDIVRTNYKHNVSYTFAYNCLFAEDGKTLVRSFNCADNYEVTFQDWNEGARYYGISYRLAEPSVNNSPYLYLIRNFGESALFTANDLLEKSRVKKNIVVLELENLRNFVVAVYDGDGRKISFKFSRSLKEFEELEYLDENNTTQIATNVLTTDMWYNPTVKCGAKDICQGSANFINNIRESSPWGNGNYIGNGHGLEVMRYVAIFVDGKEYEAIVSNSKIEGKEFKLTINSDMYVSGGGVQYADTQYPKLDVNGNPIVVFKHFMEVTINANGDFIVDNRLEVCKDNISFFNLSASMLECNYGDFSKVVVSGGDKVYINSVDDYGVPTSVGGTELLPSYPYNDNSKGVYGNKVEMFGKSFYVSQEIEAKFSGSVCNIFPRFYSDRLKCYFFPCLCTQSPQGTTPQTFSIGDVIQTHNIRHVRLSDDIEV